MESQINTHIIYCDGACSGNPGRGGWAYIHLYPDQRVEEEAGLEPSTTNNRMEMMASLQALRKVPSGEAAIVLTDSVYLIRGITQWIFGWQKRGWKNAEGKEVLNQDLWEQLSRVTRGKKIDWRYVKGHAGIAGNERVDQLAVAQTQGTPLYPFDGPLTNYPVAILPLPPKGPLPEMKKKNEGAAKSSEAFYLSYVNGVLESHQKWDSCQARVKGASQAKFKKVNSEEEAQEVLKSWGLSPSQAILKR